MMEKEEYGEINSPESTHWQKLNDHHTFFRHGGGESGRLGCQGRSDYKHCSDGDGVGPAVEVPSVPRSQRQLKTQQQLKQTQEEKRI
jgi:hypothetical protein